VSRLLVVDPVGGAAGDMLLAALLDAGAPFEPIHDAVEAVVPGRFEFTVEPVTRGGMRASFLRVESAGGAERALIPRPLADLLRAVDRAPLDKRVRSAARSILVRLGEAEARVHGTPAAEVTLRELGDDDTLLDVTGFAAAMVALGIDRVPVGSVPLGGGGVVWSDHPAHGHAAAGTGPATMELLRGFVVHGLEGPERVTPTAAAIFAALGEPVEALPAMRLEAIGYGAGSRDTDDVPNVVRVLIGTEQEADAAGGGLRQRELVVLETNLDDMSPELVADAVDALFAAGALDAWTTPVLMKKGRPAVMLSALCEPNREERVRDAFFAATPTFGIRRTPVRRSELERRSVAVSLEGGSVRVKVGAIGERIVSVTPEHDDVAELARRSGRAVRDVYEEAAAAARALRYQAAERA
jgi:uncharacterized protein (TIGR00299 family) protein